MLDVLANAATLPQWWPSVYLRVTPVTPGGPDGVGATFDLHTKDGLPYTLRWRLTVTEPVSLDGFALTAEGDLNGTGHWTFETDGPEVVITYDWRVSAAKPLLRRLSWLLKPVFSANHHWAMARGEESLKLELRRRRSSSGVKVPEPPQPTFVRRARG
ncbi:SRPBCC family protein [Paenarthrobacter nicotinovorans]|uniref:SRPBCC family protein n=1 Tax=Paenarthrobacter nicotinovorans TaxID=29320 RepID=A0ABV0GNW4_PAENI